VGKRAAQQEAISHPPVETLRMHLCWMRSTRKVTDPGPLGRTESPRLS